MSFDFTENLELGMKYLHKQGAFLTVKEGDTVNTMTISWGDIGFQWNRPVFAVMVRESRFTHELIEKSNEFTVSIPLKDTLKEALAICGSKSGRDIDKFAEANISVTASKKINTPIIKECELHYECKIIYKHDMKPDLVSDELKAFSYKNGDYHTMYFAEIVDSYKVE